MKKAILSILSLCACLSLAAQGGDTAGSRRDKLEKHVFYLADDSMNGRAAGSAEAAAARGYIVEEFNGLGIRPFFKEFTVPFKARDGQAYCNVVGIIDGTDPRLKNEYIVLGAHYDHLGSKNGKVYNGADDNASGTAAVIEVARTLSQCRDNLGRSVIIAAFDAEELGLFGSSALSQALADSIGVKNIKLMMSIDMVGWYGQSGHLALEGVGTIRNGEALVKAEAAKLGIDVKTMKFEKSPFTATDTEGFARKGVPTLAVTTGTKSPYHKPEDDPELIDYDGLDKVSEYVSELTFTAAGSAEFRGSGRVADKHRATDKPLEFGVWVGLDKGTIAFPDAKLRTNSHAGCNGGISAQVNIHEFAMRTGAEYGWFPCYFPNVYDISGEHLRYEQQAITAPLILMLQTSRENPVRAYLGVGGYYRRILKAGFTSADSPSYTAFRNQGGWQITVGVKSGPLSIEVENRFQIGRMFSGADDPKARFNTTTFKIGYSF